MLDILNGTSQFINWLTTKKRDASGIDMDTLTTVKSIQHGGNNSFIKKLLLISSIQKIG